MKRMIKLMNIFTLAIAGSTILSTASIAAEAPGGDASVAPSAEATTTSKIKQRAGLVAIFSSTGFLDTELGKAVQAGSWKATEKQLKGGEKADARGSWGHSLLHIAAANSSENPESSLKIARLLIEAGVDVNTGSKSGVTPLHEAVLSGSKKMAELLVANGAKVDVPLNGSGHCLDPDHDLVHSSVFGPLKEPRTPLYFAVALKRDAFFKLLKKSDVK